MANENNNEHIEALFYDSLAGKSHAHQLGTILRYIIKNELAMQNATIKIEDEPISASMQAKLDQAKQNLEDEGFFDPEPDNNAPTI